MESSEEVEEAIEISITIQLLKAVVVVDEQLLEHLIPHAI